MVILDSLVIAVTPDSVDFLVIVVIVVYLVTLDIVDFPAIPVIAVSRDTPVILG